MERSYVALRRNSTSGKNKAFETENATIEPQDGRTSTNGRDR